jgi:hypothetical protein
MLHGRVFFQHSPASLDAAIKGLTIENKGETRNPAEGRRD